METPEIVFCKKVRNYELKKTKKSTYYCKYVELSGLTNIAKYEVFCHKVEKVEKVLGGLLRLS